MTDDDKELLNVAVAIYAEATSPDHYERGENAHEVWDVASSWGLSFDLGCVLKYISRHGKKRSENAIVDLLKARAFLDHHIVSLLKDEGKQGCVDLSEGDD